MKNSNKKINLSFSCNVLFKQFLFSENLFKRTKVGNHPPIPPQELCDIIYKGSLIPYSNMCFCLCANYIINLTNGCLIV